MRSKENIKRLINWAKDYLRKKPYDIVHDLEHHEFVVKNCNDIIKREKLSSKVSTDAIVVAAWWHDVARHNLQENNKLFKKVSKDLA